MWLMIGVAVGSFLLSSLFAVAVRCCTAEVKQHSVSLKGGGRRHGKSSGMNRGKRGTAQPGTVGGVEDAQSQSSKDFHHASQFSNGRSGGAVLGHLELQDEDD